MDGLLSEDDLDEYEYSEDDAKHKNLKNQTTFANKPYDEAYDISQDLSMAESYDAREKNSRQPMSSREKQVKNDRYDEELDASSSLDHDQNAQSSSKNRDRRDNTDEKGSKQVGKSLGESGKSQSISNRPFDEAYEMSHSNSDESIDTQGERDKNQNKGKTPSSENAFEPRLGAGQSLASMPTTNTSKGFSNPSTQSSMQSLPPQNKSPIPHNKMEESSDGEHEESYDNIEGAYNPKDYLRLNVSSEIKDLFQYIERYKPHEVELESSLKCFIPEYIPAVGDIDSFVKVPRPDGKEDELGFKVLDEPATIQSDPTVLELQLRAMSKKLQYGDVAVRSIENASKNPETIEKWIQNVNELHRTKPPPHVTYKKNMPDIEKLMEAWPDDFENALKSTPLPSPDLDLNLLEYVKVCCALLDIPVYDNPIESLHLMFSLFLDFRNNPHFQARSAEEYKAEGKSSYGDADVLELDSYK